MKPQKDFYQVSLKITLKNKKGEILILNAQPNGSLGGFYDLPGGRIDTDEFTMPLAEIIKRELIEEVGNVKFKLNLKPVALGRHLIPGSKTKTGKDIHVLYLFFEAQYLSGDIKVSPEHTGFRWVNLSKNKPAEFFTSGTLEGIRMYLTKKD